MNWGALITLLFLLGCVLSMLRVLEYVDWSWWVATAPFTAIAVLILAAVAVVVMAGSN